MTYPLFVLTVKSNSADDVKANKVIRSPQDRCILRSCLTAICNWVDKWLLTLSLDKCLYLQLRYLDQSTTYTLNHYVLKPNTVAKDPGIPQKTYLKLGL